MSWFEAMAYCRSVGKDLPTIIHWYHAAAPAWTTQWAALGNFMSAGTQAVGQPLRLNAHGTFDMAPYQVVVWYPGGGYFGVHPIPFAADLDMIWWLFLVRSGRAVFFPEYKGSFERQVGSVTNPDAWREIRLRTAQDLPRGIDYLDTRSDVDASHVACYGLSLGAALEPIMTAVEPRLRASILLGAGLYSWRMAPDADPLNFLSHVRTPTLMINGRHDYYFPVLEPQSQAGAPEFARDGSDAPWGRDEERKGQRPGELVTREPARGAVAGRRTNGHSWSRSTATSVPWRGECQEIRAFPTPSGSDPSSWISVPRWAEQYRQCATCDTIGA